MAEYIERRRLFNALADYWKIPHDWDGGIAQPCEDALAFIENAPEEDVAPVVHGRWEAHPKDTHASLKHLEKLRCTHCWHFFYHDYGDSKNYCPNCGAHMKDGE